MKRGDRGKVTTDFPSRPQYFEPLGIPVLMNFPVGHYRENCTLPLGGEVEIDADRGTLRSFESS